MNENTVELDVSKQPAVAPVLYIGQGDHNGTVLNVKMYDNGEQLDLTGMDVRFSMKAPNNLNYYTVDGTVDGNVATFTIDEEYAGGVSGKTEIAYVQVIDDDVTTSTNRMMIIVLPSADDNTEILPGYKSLIEQFLEESQEAVDEAVAAAEAIVDYDVPVMSATMRGGAKLGSGLDMTGEVLSVDIEDAGAIPASEKGAASGVAELDSNGLVLSSQLPSYVDDVLEYSNVSAFPSTGESGKIYVATDTNLTYRWTGSAYTEISASLALGETSSTAYRGDRGAAAYAHAVTNKGAAFSEDLYKITTNSEGHVTAATPATSADIIAFLNNQALTPASIAATGAISGSSVSDSVGSLASLRESVSQTLTATATTTATGAFGISNFGIDFRDYVILQARATSTTGFALWRGDGGYLTIFDVNLSPISSTSVTVEIIAVRRS